MSDCQADVVYENEGKRGASSFWVAWSEGVAQFSLRSCSIHGKKG